MSAAPLLRLLSVLEWSAPAVAPGVDLEAELAADPEGQVHLAIRARADVEAAMERDESAPALPAIVVDALALDRIRATQREGTHEALVATLALVVLLGTMTPADAALYQEAWQAEVEARHLALVLEARS